MQHEAGPAWLAALEASGIGRAMRESLVLYPIVETLHIVGFALLVGAIAVFDLRLLGLARGLPLPRLAGLALPVAAGGLGIAAPAGALLFVTEATAYGANPVALAKFGLIALALGNLAYGHLGPLRHVRAWPAEASVPPAARRTGAVSLGLWLAVLVCGRWIAYV